MRPLFQLGPRLALCASLVREGSTLCDVGTDHGYLPIWLLKTGKIPQALACDIHPGPLYPYLGNLRPGAPQVEAYAQKALRVWMAQRKGALHTGDEDRAAFLEGLIRQIQEVYLPHT